MIRSSIIRQRLQRVSPADVDDLCHWVECILFIQATPGLVSFPFDGTNFHAVSVALQPHGDACDSLDRSGLVRGSKLFLFQVVQWDRLQAGGRGDW